jgi:outer membrane autotransporter protein
VPGLDFFLSGEFERFDKDLTRFEPGYDSNTWSGTAGADYRFSRLLTAGLALTYSRIDGDFDRSGGSFATNSYGALAYASVRPVANSFVDLVGGYARKDYSVDRSVSLSASSGAPIAGGRATGDTNGNEYTAAAHAGYDFVFKNVTVGPRVGVDFSHTTIDGFSERGATGLELLYDRQERTSLTTTAGVFASVAFSTRLGVLVPQTTLEYVHEFEDNQRAIRFRFRDDPENFKFRFQTDPPDRDYFHLGAGLVMVLPSGWSPFINYRALVGYRSESSHTVTAGVRVGF